MNLGRIYGPDGSGHNCDYSEGVCNLAKGGLLMWVIQESIKSDERCPYSPRYSETCVASSTKDEENKYLVITCPETKIKLHLGEGTNGSIRAIKGCSTSYSYNTLEGMKISLHISSNDPASLIKSPNNTNQLMDFYSLRKVVCEKRNTGTRCALETHVGHANCQRDPEKCEENVEAMSPEYCIKGICKIDSNYHCDARDTVVKSWDSIFPRPNADDGDVAGYVLFVNYKGQSDLV